MNPYTITLRSGDIEHIYEVVDEASEAEFLDALAEVLQFHDVMDEEDDSVAILSEFPTGETIMILGVSDE